MSSEFDVEDIIGATVSITTTQDEQVDGEVYCYDKESQLVILEQKQVQRGSTYRMIKTTGIKDMTIETLSSLDNKDKRVELPFVSIGKVKAEAKKTLAKYGSGVSEEAQALFLGIDKIYDCKWDDENIIVLDKVFIGPPYDEDSVVGNDQHMVNYVKKLLKNEKKKLAKK